jgi:hypothetical protein
VVNLRSIVPSSFLAILVEFREIRREALVSLGHAIQLLLGGCLSVWISVTSLQDLDKDGNGGRFKRFDSDGGVSR